MESFEALITSSAVPSIYIHRLFFILSRSPTIEIKRLIQKSRLPVALIKKILQEFQPVFESHQKKPGYVTLKPESLIEILNYFKQISNDGNPSFNWVQIEDDSLIVTPLTQIIQNRNIPKRNLDQFPCTMETLARRVEFLKTEINSSQQNILFLGDNDLTSIAVSIGFQNSNPAKEIVVLDIDEDVLSKISDIAVNNGLSITTIKQDFRLPFTEQIKKMAGRFDVIFMDPPYTIPGMELFLHRGLELLNFENGIIYACFGYSVQDLVIGLKFQQLLNDLKLVIVSQLENFNVYEEAASIGSTSHLYKLRPAQHLRMISDFRIAAQIYTGYTDSEENLLLDENITHSIDSQIINQNIINEILKWLIDENLHDIAISGVADSLLLQKIIEKEFTLYLIPLNYSESSTNKRNFSSLKILTESAYSDTEVIYNAIIFESPLLNTDSIKKWLIKPQCKHIFITLPNDISENSNDHVHYYFSPRNWIWFELFWRLETKISLNSSDFEPNLTVPCSFYHFVKREKNEFQENFPMFLFRELYYYNHLKVKNGLLNALLDYYNNYRESAVYTKREAKLFIDSLNISAEILNLEFENLSETEFMSLYNQINALKDTPLTLDSS
jgi:hypothetical protein